MHCVAIKLLLFLWKNSEAAFIVGRLASKLNRCEILGGCQQRHHIIFHASLSTSNNDVINTDRSIIHQRNNALYASPNDGINITDGSNYNKEKKHRRNKLPTSTRERTVVIMYNKPTNIITSHVSQSSTDPRKTVYEDIYSMKGFISSNNNVMPRGDASFKKFADATQIQSKLHAIGRLDADTTGLLLLTNDGALVHRITNPNAKNEEGLPNNLVQKTYQAVIMGYHDLPDESIEQSTFNDDTYPLQQLIDDGVSLSAKHGGQTKPVDDLTILSHPTRTTTHVSITISEGKNRQIRRMFHAVGSGVMKLHRVSVGRLTLSGLKQERISEDSNEGLKEGEWRLLTEKEIEQGLWYKCRNLDEFHNDQKGQPNVSRRFNHRRKRNGSAGRPKRAKRDDTR